MACSPCIKSWHGLLTLYEGVSWPAHLVWWGAMACSPCMRGCHGLLTLYEGLSWPAHLVWGGVMACSPCMRECHGLLTLYERVSRPAHLVWGVVIGSCGLLCGVIPVYLGRGLRVTLPPEEDQHHTQEAKDGNSGQDGHSHQCSVICRLRLSRRTDRRVWPVEQ